MAVWPIAAGANALIAACYFGIVWVIAGGLLRTHQVRSNALGVATALIFFTCAVHHGSHAVHLLLPLVGHDAHGEAMRRAFGWPMAGWDIFGACVGVVYLSLRSSFGRLLQTPAMFRDMSQARVDAAIAAEHEALNEAQAIGQMGSWRREIASDEWETSDEFRRILELEPGDDPRARWSAVHPDDEGDVRVAIDRAGRGQAAETSCRLIREDRSEARLQLHVRPVLDAAGTVVAVAGTVQDVTRQKAMEAALLQAEQRFRTAFDAAPIGVSLLSVDADGTARFVSTNDAMSELLGQPVEQFTGNPLATYTHPEDQRLLAERLAELARDTADKVEAEVRLMHRGGHPVWALVTAAVIPAHDDDPGLIVANFTDLSQRKAYEGQLQHLADHDALTGLFNRRRFTEELERCLAQTARYREPGAVLFLDLDGFKGVNDTLGHAAGDELIARVGRMFASAVRTTDILARVGGDEFALILTRSDEADAVRVAEKLLSSIRRDGVVVSHERHANVSVSIGITLFTPQDDVTADELVVEADVAMYDAKEAGKDRYSIYERTGLQHARLTVRENWNRRLSAAVEAGTFVLHAQPIVSLGRATPPTFELLLRLPDDHGDLIPPGTFLYNAERFGLITPIDQWVLAQAVALLADSHAAGIDLALSVNVSGKTMTDASLSAYVASLLDRRPITPGRLIIEVTETAAITNIERAQALARDLRSLGCQIALDDFGAGFASFYYLKHLSFDHLKIDGEFIRNLCTTPSDQLVVRAVVDITRGLGARTIAEFVGDDATADLLRALGVDAAQGYHLGRPEALDRVLPHLLRKPPAPAGRAATS
ncbi:EAL domain-containing protein [Paraconexibacter antarcticus]|uniref:EAL domain-containing protein n=1 Tax=Paraconexibacter antarcticus TaxID=2949664 RepID=A0ABY5DW81_9ACTN|nr:EAL domain-containing protein [Paraconexibacter antarcticus]UTI65332.1 EAL domain-containing protein [Paraconexibacter antarcticus]